MLQSRPPASTSARARAFVAFALCLFAGCALAQTKAASQSDELDVTMQIIVDPDAKLPDEVVRRIPLPVRKAADQAPAAGREPDKPEAAGKGQERAQEAQELGREAAERAKERTQDAAEQREQARLRELEDRRREPGPPADPPPRPAPPRN